jgi:hypothetical protein
VREAVVDGAVGQLRGVGRNGPEDAAVLADGRGQQRVGAGPGLGQEGRVSGVAPEPQCGQARPRDAVDDVRYGSGDREPLGGVRGPDDQVVVAERDARLEQRPVGSRAAEVQAGQDEGLPRGGALQPAGGTGGGGAGAGRCRRAVARTPRTPAAP